MTLQSLLKIGRLRSHAPSALEIERLLAAIRRNLADAQVTAVSTETRFDAAYKAIMQAALVALLANGFRPSTSEPGHHMTVLQTLPLTLGLERDRWVVLDALRRKRNLSDYTGEGIDESLVEEGIVEAERLLQDWRAGWPVTGLSWLEPETKMGRTRPAIINEKVWYGAAHPARSTGSRPGWAGSQRGWVCGL